MCQVGMNIICPNCNYEFKDGEFEKEFLKVLKQVEENMKEQGNASLGNCDYIFLKDLMETIEYSIKMKEIENV